jgi:hypothetical protein
LKKLNMGWCWVAGNEAGLGAAAIIAAGRFSSVG